MYIISMQLSRKEVKIMRLTFSEKEKPVIEKLAKICGFPLDKFISSDGSIYLRQSTVINKVEGYISQVKDMPESRRKKLVNKVMQKLAEEFPGGFVKK